MVINLDLIDKKSSIKKKNLKNYFFQKLNVADIENLDKNLESIIKKFGCPNIFINTSYPTNSNWKLSSFKKK